jgi:glycosyltransferase involved in cell wall biosynthesis
MTRSILRTFGRKLEGKIVEIGNRVDLAVFKPLRDSYSFGSEITVISVGSYVHGKGCLSLISEILPRFPRMRLVLVGRGPLHDEYTRAATQLGVLDRLELVYAGTHEEVAGLLRRADIYVHPSRTEGVPRAVLEAMAMGLPVLATNVGFLGGVVEDGVDIVLMPPNDPLALLERVSMLIESEPLRRQIGLAAAETIRSRFEWNAVFDRYRELIKTLPQAGGRET